MTVQRAAQPHERRLRVRRRRRRPDELRAVVAVLDGGLRRPVPGQHLVHLEPGVRRAQGTGRQHLGEGVEVQALRLREAHGLGEPRRHGDQVGVDGVLHFEPRARRAAVDGGTGERLHVRAHPVAHGLVAGHHSHQLALLGGHLAPAHGHFDIAPARAQDLPLELLAEFHGHRAGIDDCLVSDGSREAVVEDGLDGRRIEEHGEDDIRVLGDLGWRMANLGPGRGQCRILGRAPVPNRCGIRLAEIEGHGRAHPAQAKKSDSHGPAVRVVCFNASPRSCL